MSDNEYNTKECTEILTSVQNAEVNVMTDPYDEVRKSFFNFFITRMKEVKKSDEVLELITSKIKDKVENDEVSFEGLQDLYRMYSSQSRQSSENLLNLFRPTAGVGSVLSETIGKKEENQNEFDRVYESLSSEDLQKLDKVVKLLEEQKDN